MNIHEYQAKQLLSKYGVGVLDGGVASNSAEAVTVAQRLGGPIWVVKSQIHAGGRGKGKFLESTAGNSGGVRVVKSLDAVRDNCDQMIGAHLVTNQTGEEGKEVKKVYIEDGCEIQKELYLSLLVDRATSKVTVIASTEGGMDIELVAEQSPEKILKLEISEEKGLVKTEVIDLAKQLGLGEKAIDEAVGFLDSAYRLFVEMDLSQLEVNPMVLSTGGSLIALDAKINFDDNALFRHPEVEDLRDESEQEAAELEAEKFDLNYVKLDGSIGCMVNGAGLAMATMDIIKLYGGEPANFLDVGGGATKEKVSKAFQIILSDENVEGILVNIFGGIMRCDIIAEGIIAAAKEVSLNVPLVVRLEGTNVDMGKNMLEQSGLPIISAEDLDDAANKIVLATTEVS